MLLKVICCFIFLVVQSKLIWMMRKDNRKGTCPRSHPYAYLKGRYCCKYNKEKTYRSQGERCDGGKISLTSSCCQGDKHTRCSYGKCTDYTKGNTGAKKWPPRITKRCTKNTKQKAMYGRMTFNPSLGEKAMNKMNVQVKWNDLQFAPYNTKKRGGVYASYTIGQRGGPSGYFGVQLHARGGQFIFSIWDADRWTSSKRPKPSSRLVWPLYMKSCKRNCQDCALPHLRPWKKKGLTTGTQCKLELTDMKKGDHFDILLQQTRKQLTINTLNKGGMPKAHAQFGERDRKVTGGVWVVKARNLKTNKVMVVGKILFEGDGRGIDRLGTFDEMIGCNGCNMIYHRDTRYGPFIDDGNGKTRKPIKMEGKIANAKESKCKQYHISGSRASNSLSFEGGPLTSKSFNLDQKYHNVW